MTAAPDQDLADRVAGIRTRLLERLREAGRRLDSAKRSLDVARIIREHPLTAVAIGLAAGSLVGSRHGRDPLLGSVGALLGALVINAAKAGLAHWLRHGLAPEAHAAEAPAIIKTM